MTGSWERVCRVDEVDPGHPVGRIVGSSGQDRDRVCVVQRPGGDYVALLDRCPHRDIPLSRGTVKDGLLTCTGHFWRFDLRTGERTDLPEQRTTMYPTRVVDGWVEALLPPAPAPRSMRQWLLAEARRRSADPGLDETSSRGDVLSRPTEAARSGRGPRGRGTPPCSP